MRYCATVGAGLPGSPSAAKSASVLCVEHLAAWFLRVRPALRARRRRLPLVFFDSEAIERGVIAEACRGVKRYTKPCCLGIVRGDAIHRVDTVDPRKCPNYGLELSKIGDNRMEGVYSSVILRGPTVRLGDIDSSIRE